MNDHNFPPPNNKEKSDIGRAKINKGQKNILIIDSINEITPGELERFTIELLMTLCFND